MVIDPRIGPKNVGRDFGFDRELNRGIFTDANPGIWIGVNRERKIDCDYGFIRYDFNDGKMSWKIDVENCKCRNEYIGECSDEYIDE